MPNGKVTVRRLNEDSFAAACSEPESFRAARVEAAAGSLELAPYEVARLDVES